MTGMLKKTILALSRPLTPKPTHIQPRLQSLSNIKAVLFDIYGTLFISAAGDIGVDTAVDNHQAFQAALRAVGLPAVGSAEQLKKAIEAEHRRKRAQGIDFPEVDIVAIWRQVLAGLMPETTLTDERLQQLALEYEWRSNPVWPMPGLAALLAGLKSKGMTMGLISNAQFYTPLLLEAFLQKPLQTIGFDEDLCIFSYQVGEAKPSPRLFELAVTRLARFGIKTDEILYIGNDMLKDVWPASQLGLRTALFAGDARSLRLREDDPRCQGLQPDLIVKNLPDLLQVCGN